MEEKSPFVVIFIVGILGVIFVLMFFMPLFFKTSFDVDVDVVVDNNESNIIESIPAIYQYKNGIHKYKGELVLSAPCQALSARVITNDIYSNQITLSFKSVDAFKCERATVSQTFLVAFAAKKEVSVDAVVEGQHINLKITELPDNQTFDDL